MADDSKTFGIGVQVTADTSGATEAKAALGELKAETTSGTAAAREFAAEHQQTVKGAHEAAEALGREGHAHGFVRETAMEARHGLHGAHFAIEGLTKAA